MKTEWIGFQEGNWTETIDLRDFINKNYTGLSTDFHFAKEEKGKGFENNYISILQFEDYSLKKVNK